jgi:hypothetical protein
VGSSISSSPWIAAASSAAAAADALKGWMATHWQQKAYNGSCEMVLQMLH